MNGDSNSMTVGFVPSDEQLWIRNAVMAGGNHAIFGEAGTGKTSLIRFLVNELRAMGRNVTCVAPTGIAARNLGLAGAMTIHRAFHLPDGMVEGAMVPQDATWMRCLGTQVIDEISMVRSDVFSTIDRLLREGRRNQLPFGGVQVIVVGDCMQMPPFTTDVEHHKYLISRYGSLFCFHTRTWLDARFAVHRLNAVYRQNEDSFFLRCLHGIHSNSIADCELARLNDRLLVNGIPGVMEPECQLAWLRETAMAINVQWIDSLPGKAMRFVGTVEGYYPHDEYEDQLVLDLKPGERVLLTANGYGGGGLLYANGDFGTFLGVVNDSLIVHLERADMDVPIERNTWEHYEYQMTGDDECDCVCTGTFTQFPVLPGYAVTINRSQGMTLTGRLHIELPESKALLAGVVYTALSRAKTLAQLSCNRMIGRMDLQPQPEVAAFMKHHQLW